MKPEIKAQWVAALRSGDYKQGVGALRNGNEEFCCLGVLCDLWVKDSDDVEWTFDKWSQNYSVQENFALPPRSIRDWMGDEGAEFYGESEGFDLVAMNDHGKTFADIAKIIEKNF